MKRMNHFRQGGQAAAAFRLREGLDPKSIQSGLNLSSMAGQTMEYLETRAYHPGDDLRTVDWHAAARTKKLMVKRFHHESLAHLDIVVDATQSMCLNPQKESCLWHQVGFWNTAAQNAGFRVRFWVWADQLQPFQPESELEIFRFNEVEQPNWEMGQLPNQTLRLILSDLMWPGDPKDWIQNMSSGAAQWILMSINHHSELTPTAKGWTRLEDCESDQKLEMDLDIAAIRTYQKVLQTHFESWSQITQKYGGVFAQINAEDQDLPQQILHQFFTW